MADDAHKGPPSSTLLPDLHSVLRTYDRDLRSALRKYGRHTDSCMQNHPMAMHLSERARACNCGWDTVCVQFLEEEPVA